MKLLAFAANPTVLWIFNRSERVNANHDGRSARRANTLVQPAI